MIARGQREPRCPRPRVRRLPVAVVPLSPARRPAATLLSQPQQASAETPLPWLSAPNARRKRLRSRERALAVEPAREPTPSARRASADTPPPAARPTQQPVRPSERVARDRPTSASRRTQPADRERASGAPTVRRCIDRGRNAALPQPVRPAARVAHDRADEHLPSGPPAKRRAGAPTVRRCTAGRNSAAQPAVVRRVAHDRPASRPRLRARCSRAARYRNSLSSPRPAGLRPSVHRSRRPASRPTVRGRRRRALASSGPSRRCASGRHASPPPVSLATLARAPASARGARPPGCAP